MDTRERKSISPTTKVLGVLGYPIAHSLSPAMFNAAFNHTRLDWVYLAFPVKPEDLAAALTGLKCMGLQGANVTVPLKERILELLDEMTPAARLIGAVNCVAVRGENLVGHNTDGDGFLYSLRKDAGFDPGGCRALLLGAGGAARAIALALGQSGCKSVTIANRTPERAEKLAEKVRQATGSESAGVGLDENLLRDLAAESDLVVQTSPVGMYPEDQAPEWFDADWLNPGTMAVDIIYRPRPTALLRQAAKRGCRVLDGLGMLVYQGALAYTWWTGEPAPVEVMREAAENILGND